MFLQSAMSLLMEFIFILPMVPIELMDPMLPTLPMPPVRELGGCCNRLARVSRLGDSDWGVLGFNRELKLVSLCEMDGGAVPTGVCGRPTVKELFHTLSNLIKQHIWCHTYTSIDLIHIHVYLKILKMQIAFQNLIQIIVPDWSLASAATFIIEALDPLLLLAASTEIPLSDIAGLWEFLERLVLWSCMVWLPEERKQSFKV